LAGHVENEHFCLQLGQAAGLVCVNSEVHRFGKELAIVVARYDRQLSQDQKHWLRLHQEDFCQVLACQPANKYESNGGPGIAQIMEVLRGSREPEIDRRRFMQAIAFNYVIGGTDAHAKNYSLLHAPTHFRLAPLYDIASILPYIDRRRDMRLAMRVGRHYDPEYILPRHWEALARQCGFPADDLLIILRDLIVQLPDLALTVYRTIQEDGLDHSVLKRLVDGIANRCAHLAKRFPLAEP
jgi:serine/threonine-protein kinase HipA